MIYTIFEDQFTDTLFPINLTRASFELRCGAFTNIERIEKIIGTDDKLS